MLGLAAEKLASRVERLLAAPTALVEWERKGRSAPDDLRPPSLALVAFPHADGVPDELTHGERAWLEAELATRPSGVRPRELLEALGPGVRRLRPCRLHQWIERDGARVEPLAACGREPGVVAPHAEGRAT